MQAGQGFSGFPLKFRYGRGFPEGVNLGNDNCVAAADAGFGDSDENGVAPDTVKLVRHANKLIPVRVTSMVHTAKAYFFIISFFMKSVKCRP
jgi:hypothetical protein